jgi:hypothetical protein
LDACALIDLNNDYPDNVPIFSPIWRKMDQMIIDGRLVSHLEVLEEISHHEDATLSWCKSNKGIFRDLEEKEMSWYKKVELSYEEAEWKLQNSGDNPWADPWVVALTACEDATLVTNEKGRRRNSLPNICKLLGLKCVNVVNFIAEIQSEK